MGSWGSRYPTVNLLRNIGVSLGSITMSLWCTVMRMAELTYAQRVSLNIKVLVYAAGVKQSELCAAIDRTPSVTSARLNGRAEFSLGELEKIAPLLNTTPEALANPTA